ncbi:TauD/TfdA family dioxygenase [Streptomyces sp. NPDC060235]|uniref:TauD/TfdA family dioxygenase n=1 Tax=Streptomyces sp. NPDC060235 TaxID=3347080 RepID=UPI00365EF176
MAPKRLRESQAPSRRGYDPNWKVMQKTRAHVVSFENYEETAKEITIAYRSALHRFGYVHGVGIPDGFDYPGFLAEFGAFYPGPSGNVIEDVKAEAGMDDVYYGSNRRALLPHTEGYEFTDLPPRYLALWCVTPPAGAGGETTLFDARDVVQQLPAADRQILEREVLGWVSSAGLRRKGIGQESVHPILETVHDEQLLRFSLNNIVLPAGSDRVELFLERVRQEFEAGHNAVSYERNDLLHWDNWRVLHSRTAFEDPQRHLRRIQIRHWSDGRAAAEA